MNEQHDPLEQLLSRAFADDARAVAEERRQHDPNASARMIDQVMRRISVQRRRRALLLGGFGALGAALTLLALKPALTALGPLAAHGLAAVSASIFAALPALPVAPLMLLLPAVLIAVLGTWLLALSEASA
ncbi:MAG: hypothetical protein R3E86_11905 [Pseudomonadales bacterium]